MTYRNANGLIKENLGCIFGEALKLMYSGHEELGRELIKKVWPDSCGEYDKPFLSQFNKRLESSEIWNDIRY